MRLIKVFILLALLMPAVTHGDALSPKSVERVEKGFQAYRQYRDLIEGYSNEEINAIRARIVETWSLPPGAISGTMIPSKATSR